MLTAPSSSLVSCSPAPGQPCPAPPPHLPWSHPALLGQLVPEKPLSLGRTHRSNQVSAPEYIFLISELAGERRFASIVAKRLESLVSGGGECWSGQRLMGGIS